MVEAPWADQHGVRNETGMDLLGSWLGQIPESYKRLAQ